MLVQILIVSSVGTSLNKVARQTNLELNIIGIEITVIFTATNLVII